MSDLDGLRLDADGFLDMDQFPDDGSDLGVAEAADLRALLLDDPVAEPPPDAWDAMLDHVVEASATDAAGPFGLDDGLVPEAVADAEAFDPAEVADATDVDAEPDVEPDVDPSDADDDGGGTLDDVDDGGLGLDGLDGGELDLDVDLDLDGGLDLGADAVVDDVPDVEEPADIAHDFEDTL